MAGCKCVPRREDKARALFSPRIRARIKCSLELHFAGERGRACERAEDRRLRARARRQKSRKAAPSATRSGGVLRARLCATHGARFSAAAAGWLVPADRRRACCARCFTQVRWPFDFAASVRVGSLGGWLGAHEARHCRFDLPTLRRGYLESEPHPQRGCCIWGIFGSERTAR